MILSIIVEIEGVDPKQLTPEAVDRTREFLTTTFIGDSFDMAIAVSTTLEESKSEIAKKLASSFRDYTKNSSASIAFGGARKKGDVH